jgi:hypothetical protein
MVWQLKTSMRDVMERDLRFHSSKWKTGRILVDSPTVSGYLLSRKSAKITRVKNQWYSIWLKRESINAKMSIKLSDAVVIAGHASEIKTYIFNSRLIRKTIASHFRAKMGTKSLQNQSTEVKASIWSRISPIN